MVNDESAELDTAGGSSELGEENIFHGYVEVHTKQFKPSKKGPLRTLTWIRQSDALNFFWSGCLTSLLATVQLTTVLVRPAQFSGVAP
jgi:hypothetical protein